ncbi:hypothetical protein MKW98_010526 [Papaver atlanticum]|uniref:Uncharacterized protein n=1 Tax=Papaver atlanticum TaxID=357466 RepID=A0AAD4S3I4_9MAGN|nr:hypothetical protein MKW98_010526 [Papaver atlanticum]
MTILLQNLHRSKIYTKALGLHFHFTFRFPFLSFSPLSNSNSQRRPSLPTTEVNVSGGCSGDYYSFFFQHSEKDLIRGAMSSMATTIFDRLLRSELVRKNQGGSHLFIVCCEELTARVKLEMLLYLTSGCVAVIELHQNEIKSASVWVSMLVTISKAYSRLDYASTTSEYLDHWRNISVNLNELDMGRQLCQHIRTGISLKTIYTAGVIMVSQTSRVVVIPSLFISLKGKNQRFGILSSLELRLEAYPIETHTCQRNRGTVNSQSLVKYRPGS